MGPLATTRALTPDGEITTLNAWVTHDSEVSPGGSSSGTATAVAARMASAGIGTQTGGSITSPSLAQGLTGLKPTLGRVSLRGVIPLSYSRDHAGPLARDAADAALLLQAMAGPDPADLRTLGLPPVPDYLAAATPVEGDRGVELRWPMRVGVPEGWVGAGGDETQADRESFLSALEAIGGELVEIALPPEWEGLTSSAMNAVRLPERSEIFLETLRRDVRLFGVALSPWINGLLLSGDEFLKGQRARVALLGLVLDRVFSSCDVVLQSGAGPMDMVGLPLIAFPIGMRERSGVAAPHGVLAAGLPFGEERLLALASAWQAVTDWHRRRPLRLSEEEQARARPTTEKSRGRLGVGAVAELAE
jgi:Asp-tRNA(Asn)/Glu-tRNA(Gln) amidotransferase A subunit family amidase